MKSNTGIVMQLSKRHVFIMTDTGEFLKVKLNKNAAKIGELFTGEVSSKNTFYKYAAAAASLIFVLLSGSGAYAYYTPTASILVNINPSVKLQLNRWDRVIKSIPLNEDGSALLQSLNLNNNSINSALDKIIDESKKDNFINEDYIENGKTITIAVEDNKLKKDFNLSKFEEHAKENKLNVKIIKKEEFKPQLEDTKKSETNETKDAKPNTNNNNNNNNNNNPQDKKSNPDNSNSKGNSNRNSSTDVPNNNSVKSESNPVKSNGNISKDELKDKNNNSSKYSNHKENHEEKKDSKEKK
ncbi:anti-sigma factor domain-containing protein [Clostridium sp. YIM B02515]|uniref:Anti-sigma factor domain-containing protein n=1 Tax=Clostridium rhizosphaerae TaxID=2803861 RepID=A0ABS1T8P5_9CLOT|nr:anti-sigma factor domain-containing protein [Clostridium rhizosphaerae]MBL4935702.1 anti-sigma factor domain-containing protein [Clostridium rhizosphaerae]